MQHLKKILICAILGMCCGNMAYSQLKIQIDPAKKYQTIHSFGASDAWRCQWVGEYWPVEKREAIADLLFSREFDKKGNPKGIGLSLWRFNIGSGSAEQGDSSTITASWRRAECFMDAAGNYNWTKQAGQRWFLEAARKRGVEKTLGFSISAPVFMSENGYARATHKDKFMNIQPDKFQDYARFMATVCKHFGFDYLSPVNEPQWEWNGTSQEGTQATNAECRMLIRYLDQELKRAGTDTKVVFGEAGDIKYLFEANTEKPDRDNQIEEMFSAGGRHSIYGLPTVHKVVTGHSYWSTWGLDLLIKQRKELAAKMEKYVPDHSYWQTEYCVMEQNDEVGGGRPRDLGMNTALYVARLIHFDLTLANAASWQWWTALTDADYKDGLIFLDNNAGSYENSEELKKDGYYRDSKLLWALGNFSRFVRPGMKRIAISEATGKTEIETAKDLMLSAYTDGVKTIIVAVNYTGEVKQLAFEGMEHKKASMYETSESANLACRGKVGLKKTSIPARSVVTLVIE